MPLLTTRAGASSRAYGFGGAAGEELGGMVLLTPTSIAYSGTSATIGANGSVEFSACSSLSLNGVFSADYDNYNVVFRASSATAETWHVRLRASGSDNSTASSYTRQQLNVDGTTVSGSRISESYFQGLLIDYATVAQNVAQLSFYGPNLAQPTALRTTTVLAYQRGYILDRAYTHNQSTAYDGFSILTLSAGTTSGFVSVYGLVGA